MSQQPPPNPQGGLPPVPPSSFVRSPNPGGRMMSPNHGGGYGARMPGSSPRPPHMAYGPGMMSGLEEENKMLPGQSHPGTPPSNNPLLGNPPNSSNNPQQPMQQPGVSQQPQPQTPNMQQPPQPQQTKEINTATVCRIGQETVQEIVSRIQDVFSYLKSLQPPVGSNIQERDRQTLEKQQRLQEVLKGIVQLFKRLKVCWEKCQENTLGMEITQMESLIPIVEQRDLKAELEKKRGDSYKQAYEEHNELSQQLLLRNRHIKEVIDQMRNIIWEINTMLAMREAT